MTRVEEEEGESRELRFSRFWDHRQPGQLTSRARHRQGGRASRRTDRGDGSEAVGRGRRAAMRAGPGGG